MLRTILPLLLGLAAILPAASARSEQRSRTVVLISAPSEPIDMDRLQETLLAHMSDLDVEVIVRAVMDLPADPETRKDVARALIQDEHALSAVWVAPEEETLMLLVSDRGTEQILSRSLARHLDNEDQVYDAAASIVRAALTPWFYSDDSPPPEAPPTSTSRSRSASIFGDSSDSRNERDSASNTDESGAGNNDSNRSDAESRQTAGTVSSRGRHRPKAHFVLRGAYALDGDLSGGLSHGGALGMGALLFRRLLLSADLSIFQAADMGIPEQNIRLLRLPFRLQAALFVNLSRRVLLGIGAALVLDIARVRGADESAAPEEIQRVRIGFSPNLLLRVFATPRFTVDLQSGVDIFNEDHHYRWNYETVLTNGRTHVGGTLGMTFYFPAAPLEVKR